MKSKDKSKKGKTKDGLSFDVAEYDPGEVRVGDRDIADYYPFKFEQLEWLREFSKDLDADRATRELGLNPRTVKEQWMQSEKFKVEMMEIFDVYKKNIKMTTENSAAALITFMEKLGKDYDTAEKVGDKAKIAGPMSKLLDSYLRASGHYQHGGHSEGTNVVINIDLGGDEDNAKHVSINGEKQDKK